MTTRESLHALVDQLADSELEMAEDALLEIRGLALTEEQLRELDEASAACDRGEGIDAREFLAKLRARDRPPSTSESD